MKNSIKTLSTMFATVLMLALLAGCSTETGSVLNPEPVVAPVTDQQAEVDGMMVFRNGDPILMAKSTIVNGGVTIWVDDSDDIFSVEFLDKNDATLDLDADKYSMCWSDGNSGLATYECLGTSGWEFCLYGQKAGSASFQIILENEKGRTYTSPAIPLKVKAAQDPDDPVYNKPDKKADITSGV